MSRLSQHLRQSLFNLRSNPNQSLNLSHSQPQNPNLFLSQNQNLFLSSLKSLHNLLNLNLRHLLSLPLSNPQKSHQNPQSPNQSR